MTLCKNLVTVILVLTVFVLSLGRAGFGAAALASRDAGKSTQGRFFAQASRMLDSPVLKKIPAKPTFGVSTAFEPPVPQAGLLLPTTRCTFQRDPSLASGLSLRSPPAVLAWSCFPLS